MFYEKIKYICNENGITPTKLLSSLNLSRGNISNWKSGSSITASKIKSIVEFFKNEFNYNVTADFLIFDYLENPTDTLINNSGDSKMNKTLEKINSLINKSGKSKYKVALDLGLDKSIISDWMHGKGNPLKQIGNIARYFGVTTDYLIYDELTDPSSTLLNIGIIEPQKSEVERIYDKLNDAHKALSMGRMKGYLKIQEMEEENETNEAIS